jgi:hypothetical protein
VATIQAMAQSVDGSDTSNAAPKDHDRLGRTMVATGH